MRPLLATVLSILLIAAAGEAANPLLEPVPLSSEVADLVRQAPDGRLYLEIDDMLIPVASAEKSASYWTTWTNGVVYYQFHSSVDASDGRPLSGDGAARRAAFRAAAMEWQATVAGLTFVEGTGSGNYILVKSADYNNSWVGMNGGAQDLNLYNWNQRYVIAHEIGHALTLMHEQSRTDRNSYITVHYENIRDDMESNYDIWSGTANHGSYDFESVMHYGRCDFALDGWNCSPNFTMDATVAGAAAVGRTQAEANAAMGQRADLSPGDIAGVRALYTPAGTIFASCFENGRSNAWSSSVGESVSCAHDLCFEGDPLSSGCDPCVEQICAYDSYCCSDEWDDICVGYVTSICGQSCD